MAAADEKRATSPPAEARGPSVLGQVAPLLAVLIWSGNTIVYKAASSVIEPASMTLYRWVIATLVLTPFVIRGVWELRREFLAVWPKVAVLGVLGMAVYQGLAYEAARTTTAVKMGLVQGLMPLMTTLIAAALGDERLTPRSVGGAVLSLVGVAIVTGLGKEGLADGVTIGDALMVVGVAAYGLYGVLIRRWKLPFPTWPMVYVQILFAILATLPFYLASRISTINAANAGVVLYASILPSIASPYLWLRAVKELGAARATQFANATPVGVALFAWVLLGEQLTATFVVGGLITMLGVIVGTSEPQERTTRPTKGSSR